jgi:hypothetical protein
MRLRDGGIDIFYIDESDDKRSYVVTAVTIPFLRKIDNVWTITWPTHLDGAKQWRKRMKRDHRLGMSRELHGTKLASGRGNYVDGRHNYDKPKANAVFRQILANMDFIPDASIITVAARRGAGLFGKTRLEAALYALLQRMRMQCRARDTNAIVFFDEGHPEYRRLYRQAQVYLPTGSRFGGWAGGATRNLQMDMFTKDANDKNSKHCFFTQAADLIAFSALLKVRHEHGELEPWQAQYNLGNLFDSVPQRLLNLRASAKLPRDGIVRLW